MINIKNKLLNYTIWVVLYPSYKFGLQESNGKL